MQHEEKNNRLLAIMPHPDDVEILCGGTLLRLGKEAGCEIHVVTMTPGDKGSNTLPSDEIGRIRRTEAEAGAKRLGAASYRCLEFSDLEIVFDNPARQKVAGILREINPFLVFTTPRDDYMLDHEMTSALVRDACFNSAVRLYPAAGQPTSAVPYLYYSDAISGRDIFGSPSRVSCVVDISAQIDAKAEALKCHDSQRSWLRTQHGMDDYIHSMLSWCAKRGGEIGVAYAEAFCQHLGHPHPQNDLLSKLLTSPAEKPS